jgi:glyoxylase-like metal-dependent hydrolase (beta-lactamase superfamily II)
MQVWRVGDVTITKVVEMELYGGTSVTLPGLTPEVVLQYPWLIPDYADESGRLKSSVHALIVDTPSCRILVDTCFGNDKQGRPAAIFENLKSEFLNDLREAGCDPDSVDYVLCTHLHIDHVGWNTVFRDGKWVPTFPKARYLMGREEFQFWRSQRDDHHHQNVFADSVQPVFEAGLVDLVEMNHVICDEISLIPTTGHTPGHVSVQIRSQGHDALITGDFLHHPAQLARPDCGATVDVDRSAAIATRQRMLSELVGSPTLLIGTHFPAPTAGKVARDQATYRLLAEPGQVLAQGNPLIVDMELAVAELSGNH